MTPLDPIQQSRAEGDDLADLSESLANMSVVERPTAESTPMPNLLHRPRTGQKRNQADSTMLERDQVISSNDIANLQTYSHILFLNFKIKLF